VHGYEYSIENREGSLVTFPETQEVAKSEDERLCSAIIQLLVENLQDDEFAYCIVRVFCGDKKAQSSFISQNQSRDLLISWIGPELPRIEHAKKKVHLGDIRRIVQSHRELTAFGKKNFNEEVLSNLASSTSADNSIE